MAGPSSNNVFFASQVAYPALKLVLKYGGELRLAVEFRLDGFVSDVFAFNSDKANIKRRLTLAPYDVSYLSLMVRLGVKVLDGKAAAFSAVVEESSVEKPWSACGSSS